MTGEKVFRGNHLARRGVALDITTGEENIRQGYEENMVVYRGALGVYGTAEEGGYEGVEWLHSFDLGRGPSGKFSGPRQGRLVAGACGYCCAAYWVASRGFEGRDMSFA